MNIQVIDNVERNIASVLIPAIAAANDIRIAVAHVSNDGLKKIMPSMHDAISAGATIEFMVGMDTHATDPVAIKKLYDLCQNILVLNSTQIGSSPMENSLPCSLNCARKNRHMSAK